LALNIRPYRKADIGWASFRSKTAEAYPKSASLYKLSKPETGYLLSYRLAVPDCSLTVRSLLVPCILSSMCLTMVLFHFITDARLLG
jgi:hypothetical protein